MASQKPPRKRRNKYGAVRTKIGDLTFDSKKEAARWLVLKDEEEQGLITDLQRQVPFQLFGKGRSGAKYVADFTYVRDGAATVEDCKGRLTDVYRLKKKMMKEFLNIDILET